ncbi:phenylalanyl-tRNA synthetase beta chain [Culex quinquefasciatus]|uniref:Phenylalanyl-tRNA synthetase beta chain n=1 Tax=Culex quinquefasciatus TaxID=7176 RepID=B0X5L7_CULQU|nr:phenylalanyl-tRNA synthetase beta chain [Culex quinquefasciatus]|eukprot:XP_001864939.1 phenylalanyl-tRNA synthetase beta chain [Culex quinquefasciatus]
MSIPDNVHSGKRPFRIMSIPENKLCFELVDAAKDASENVIYWIDIPANRYDLLCLEGLAYNRIPKTLPATIHIARQYPREQIAQAGFTDGLTITLCSRDDIAGKLNRNIEKIPAVHIANPISSRANHAHPRTAPWPRTAKLPFPLSCLKCPTWSCRIPRPKSDQERALRLCRQLQKTAGYEVIHGLLDRVMLLLGCPGKRSRIYQPSLIAPKIATLKSFDWSSRTETIPNGDKVTRPVGCPRNPAPAVSPITDREHRCTSCASFPTGGLSLRGNLRFRFATWFYRRETFRRWRFSISSRCRLVPCASHVFNAVHNSKDYLLGRRPSQAKKTIAEFAVLRMLQQNPYDRVVHLVSRNALAEVISMDCHQKFGHNSGCKERGNRNGYEADCQGTNYRNHGRQVEHFVAALEAREDPDHRHVDIAVGRPGRFNFTYNASRITAMSKPVYNAVTKFSLHKPVIVRSRKLNRLTGQGEHKPFLDRMANKTLKETLSQGVAYIHEGLTESDHHIVEQLFDSGAVQIAVVTRDLYIDPHFKTYLLLQAHLSRLQQLSSRHRQKQVKVFPTVIADGNVTIYPMSKDCVDAIRTDWVCPRSGALLPPRCQLIMARVLLGHVKRYLESRALAWVHQRPTKIRTTIRWRICITRIRNGFRHQQDRNSATQRG